MYYYNIHLWFCHYTQVKIIQDSNLHSLLVMKLIYGYLSHFRRSILSRNFYVTIIYSNLLLNRLMSSDVS